MSVGSPCVLTTCTWAATLLVGKFSLLTPSVQTPLASTTASPARWPLTSTETVSPGWP
ncbi:hypothetical protein D3C72_728410 [compost metagenome]